MKWGYIMQVEKIIELLETRTHNMLLDLTNLTTFQQTVFNAISEISVEDICTYKGIAEAIGKPGAAQAVGSPVLKNPVSCFIPTHRVLPQRSIGIYRGGAGHLRDKLSRGIN